MEVKEMKEEYDFSKGKRGAVLRPDPNKIRITIRLDKDIIDHFKQEVHDAGGGNYQTLINNALREYLSQQQTPRIENIMRKVLKEELQALQPAQL